MKYSNFFGALFSLLIIVTCFIPWVYIPSLQTTITGLQAPGTNFGKPGMVNIVMSSLAFFLFIIPAIWAKRVNLFVGAFNIAWAARNYLILTQCELGECPEKKSGIYVLVALSALLLIMTLFPRVELKNKG